MREGYRTVFDVIHEARLEAPLSLFTNKQLADWLSEAELDIQINVLLMVHEDFVPIVYQEHWVWEAGEEGLPPDNYDFSLPGIDPNTGEEVTNWYGLSFRDGFPGGEGNRMEYDGNGETITAFVNGEKYILEIYLIEPDPSAPKLIFRDDSRTLLTPLGWARLYVDWLLYKIYKAAREYRDAKNHKNEWQEKRDAFCGYVGDRWAPARFRG